MVNAPLCFSHLPTIIEDIEDVEDVDDADEAEAEVNEIEPALGQANLRWRFFASDSSLHTILSLPSLPSMPTMSNEEDSDVETTLASDGLSIGGAAVCAPPAVLVSPGDAREHETLFGGVDLPPIRETEEPEERVVLAVKSSQASVASLIDGGLSLSTYPAGSYASSRSNYSTASSVELQIASQNGVAAMEMTPSFLPTDSSSSHSLRVVALNFDSSLAASRSVESDQPAVSPLFSGFAAGRVDCIIREAPPRSQESICYSLPPSMISTDSLCSRDDSPAFVHAQESTPLSSSSISTTPVDSFRDAQREYRAHSQVGTAVPQSQHKITLSKEEEIKCYKFLVEVSLRLSDIAMRLPPRPTGGAPATECQCQSQGSAPVAIHTSPPARSSVIPSSFMSVEERIRQLEVHRRLFQQGTSLTSVKAQATSPVVNSHNPHHPRDIRPPRRPKTPMPSQFREDLPSSRRWDKIRRHLPYARFLFS